MRILAIINPVAGRTQADAIKQSLERLFGEDSSCQLDIYETTGDEDVAGVVRAALISGVDQVFAAGGDGTVSAVVDALVNTDVPLGIIPTGTTNVLAQELNIPLNAEKACRLLAGRTAIRSIDALQLGDKHFVLSIGIGLSAKAIEGTSREGKRRFGPLAYVWSILNAAAGAQPHTFTIVADGKKMRVRAADVLLANVSIITRPFRWGPHIEPDDGRIDICVIKAKNSLGIFGAAFDIAVPGRPRRERNLIYWRAHHTILVFAEQPLLVQGDGELLGQTPVEVVIVPGAVRVLVPEKDGKKRKVRLPLMSNGR
jgi:YegS/Rv2252/BmrU family lipid kinase